MIRKNLFILCAIVAGPSLVTAQTTAQGNKLNIGTLSTGDNSISGNYSGAIGENNSVSGQDSLAIGENNNIGEGVYAGFSLGGNNIISAQRSGAFGSGNTIGEVSSLIVGENNSSTGYTGGSMEGYGNLYVGANISGNGNNYFSAVIGLDHTVESLSYGFVTGASNSATGTHFLLGLGLVATDVDQASVLVGQYNLNSPPSGKKYLFVVGNGSDTVPSNALEIYRDGNAKFTAPISLFNGAASIPSIVLDPVAGQISINGQNLLVPNASGNVGIGTSNPTLGKLQVENGAFTINTTGSALADIRSGSAGAAADAYLRFVNNGAIKGTFGYDASLGGISIFSGSSAAPSDNPQLFISSSGNVGVGNSNPAAVFDVTVGNTGAARFSRNSTQYLEFTAEVGGNKLVSYSGTGAEKDFILASGGGVGAAGNFRFYPNGVERMTLLSNGNLGVGTPTPVAPLDVQAYLDNTNPAGITVRRNATQFITINEHGGGEHWITGVSPAANPKPFYITNSAVGGSPTIGSSDMTFQIAAQGSSGVSMTLQAATGNLGIGTTTPQSLLSVQSGTLDNSSSSDRAFNAVVASPNKLLTGGTSSGQVAIIANDATPTADFGGSLGFGAVYDSSAHVTLNAAIRSGRDNATSGNSAGYLSFLSRPSVGSLAERMRITSTGLVNLYGGSPASAKIVFDPNTPQITIDGVPVLTGTTSAAQTFTAPSYSFNSGSANRVAIDAGGLVTIGDGARPASDNVSLLHVKGALAVWAGPEQPTSWPNTRASAVFAKGPSTGTISDNYLMMAIPTKSTSALALRFNSAISDEDERYKTILGVQKGSIEFKTAIGETNYQNDWGSSGVGSVRMKISALGNVGIGTIAPTAKFAVQGNGSGSGLTALFTDVNATSTTQVAILDNGRVGVGTAAPNTVFHIVRSTNTAPVTLKVQNTAAASSNAGAELLLGTSTSVATDSVGASILASRTDVATAGDTDLVLRNSAGPTMTERMRIKANGSVGIGTSTPQATFEAQGTIALGTGISNNSGAGHVVLGKYNDSRTNDGGVDHTQGVFIVGAGTGTNARQNAIRVMADGTLLVKTSGDISPGEFTSGPTP